jgi:hypothetical protein
MNLKVVSIVFVVAAAYDGILGLAFLFAPAKLFEVAGVTPPNHFGYVQFPAALLIVFGIMFAAIARNPVANRGLIPYGMLLKVSYCAVVFYYWLAQGIPYIWKPFAIADLVFLGVFYLSYRATATASS